MTFRRWMLAVVVGVGAAGLVGCATKGGDETAAAAPAAPGAADTSPGIAVEEVEEAGPGSLVRSSTVTATATVESVDQTTREVKLRGPEGNVISFRAGPEVRNLAQVEKGDTVTATYYESLVVQVRKPGEATPGVGSGSMVGRAEPGQRPAALGVGSVVLTSTIEAIAPDRSSVTLKDSDGSVVTVPVRDPANLEGVAVGDLVEITYTEAVAIAVDEPGAAQ